MVIDNATTMYHSPVTDVKVAKKEQAQEPRSIEKTEKSDDAKLNFSRQDVAKEEDRVELYNSQGKFENEPSSRPEQTESILMVV